MNDDLRRAAHALAEGRRAEASVYAWNALATVERSESADARELARIAEKLDDPRLLHELERRGLWTAPPREQAPHSPRTFRLRQLWFPAAVLIIMLAVAVTAIPTESGPLRPTADDAATSASTGPPPLTLSSAVWLVRIGSTRRIDVQALARDLERRYGVPVGVQADVPLPAWAIDVRQRRLIAEELLHALALSYGVEGRAAVIGITDFDMYSKSQGHVFSLRERRGYGVVSTAQLSANVLARLGGHTRLERTRKLVARNIGFLFLRRSEVSDTYSLLRSPMSSVSDIDALREKL